MIDIDLCRCDWAKLAEGQHKATRQVHCSAIICRIIDGSVGLDQPSTERRPRAIGHSHVNGHSTGTMVRGKAHTHTQTNTKPLCVQCVEGKLSKGVLASAAEAQPPYKRDNFGGANCIRSKYLPAVSGNKGDRWSKGLPDRQAPSLQWHLLMSLLATIAV